ncbi:hypothetical protein DAPPUDRAFT_98168 [Daphnia pulex]|uniref:Uncharacterized protein n=1 Tax=Daphnia pulex TaxID=6669 RepID=E9G2I9_DAPPU|nr:hypothetical protein DAPPUDRAFT_98168 [Daphnia pulex]|eukprot:EFX86261.1 hypothetical protein DAPPUDRAFT_98168 [Daphnia pulex]
MATLATSGLLSFDETVHTSSRIYHHYTTNSFIKNRRSAECIMQLIQGKLKAYPWVIFSESRKACRIQVELLRAVSKQAIQPLRSVIWNRNLMAVNRWLAKVGWNVHQVAPVSSATHFGHFVPRRSRNGDLASRNQFAKSFNSDLELPPNGERCDHGVTKTD